MATYVAVPDMGQRKPEYFMGWASDRGNKPQLPNRSAARRAISLR